MGSGGPAVRDGRPLGRVLVRWFCAVAAIAATAMGLAVYAVLGTAWDRQAAETRRQDLLRTGDLIRSRLEAVEARTRIMADDSGIRAGLMLGLVSRVRRAVEGEFPAQRGAAFAVRTPEGTWVGADPGAVPAAPPRWVFRVPVKRGGSVLGEAWGVYDLSLDRPLLKALCAPGEPGLGVRKAGSVRWLCGPPGEAEDVPGLPGVVRGPPPGKGGLRRRAGWAWGVGLGLALGLAWGVGAAVARRVAGPLSRLASQMEGVGHRAPAGGVGGPYRELAALEQALASMQRRIEEEADRARYRDLFETAADPMLLVDGAGRILDLNEAAGAWMGGGPVGKDLRVYVPPASVSALLDRARAGDTTPVTVRMEGEPPRHLEISGRRIELAGREVVLLQGRDVSGRVRAERRVRAQESFLRRVLDHLDEAVLILDPDLRVRYYNRPFTALWGLAPSWLDRRPGLEEAMREVARAGLYDEDAVEALIRGRIEDLRGPGSVIPIQTPRKDGRSVEAYAAPLPDGGFLLTYRDVTERVQRERDRAMLAGVVAQSREGMAVASPLGSLVYVNSAYERLCGVERPELLGRPYWEVPAGGGPDPGEVEAALAVEGVWTGRIALARDGGEVIHEVTVTGITLEPGEVYRVIARRDVSEEVRLQVQLAQAQKMEAIGVLAGGIAHDFNNILAALVGNVEVLRSRLPAEGPHRRALERMDRALERAGGLVRRILTFSGRQPRDEGPVDLRAVVDEAVGLARSGVPEGVRLVWKREEAPAATTWGEASELCQAVMNLLVNAIQAVGEGGSIEVRLDREESGARIVVRDDGPGIPAELRDRVFDPFFTTKGPGEGTGLGLALVKAIVERHGGTAEIAQVRPRGTEVRLWLPLRGAPTRTGSDRGAAPVPPLRVLVVDDDVDVLEALVESLRGRGHHAEAARSGAEALERWDRGGFDVVICDARMPGMGGREVLARIKRRSPGATALLLTGRLDDLGPGPEDARLLKPAGVLEVERAIGAAMSRRSREEDHGEDPAG